MRLCASLAPDIASIAPLRYSFLKAALRSQARYSAGDKCVGAAIGMDMTASRGLGDGVSNRTDAGAKISTLPSASVLNSINENS